MPEKLNPVEKFQRFWRKLSLEEQEDLYFVLSMIRGPDKETLTQTEAEKLKEFGTARIRGILGIDLQGIVTLYRDITREEFDKLKDWYEESSLGVTYESHHRSHVFQAFRSLNKHGYIQEVKE